MFALLSHLKHEQNLSHYSQKAPLHSICGSAN